MRAPGPPVMRARDLSVVRGSRTLVKVSSFAVHRGLVHVLLGPNGAGKSTLLKALNGLEPADGVLEFDGRPVRGTTGRLELRRQTAAIAQKPYLLSTSVLKNVASGLRYRGVQRREAHAAAAEALELLGVAHLADRKPAKLSGGEAQRVSIARALACDPRVLFLDEPIAALDPPTRRGLVEDLLRILDQRGIAAVWVTHDRDEALAVGDEVTFIERGEVVQSGPALEVLSHPATESFASFLGLDTYLEGRVVVGPTGDLRFILDTGHELYCGEAPLGHAVACIPPEDVVLLTAVPEHNMSLRNVLQGTVREVRPDGRLLRVTVAADGLDIAALVTKAALEELALTVGSPVAAAFKAAALHPIPRHERREQARERGLRADLHGRGSTSDQADRSVATPVSRVT
jgi:tungstate transport system ATP-binding protein